jgi:NAD(P)H-dependent FMN reductase
MNALLLVGSPKPGRSASRSFGEAVLQRLDARGATTRVERVTPVLRSAAALASRLEDIAWADLVVLSFPVYVDSLPAPVTRLLEAWADAAPGSTPPASEPKRLAVLTQCGFPEAHQCATAVEVCREFCREVGVRWAGALTFGTGGALEGRAVERSPLARVAGAFDDAADALMAGREIPDHVRSALAKPIARSWIYTWFGGLGWWWLARKRGNRQPLRLRRYVQ